MKVKQLIKKLEKCDENCKVLIYIGNILPEPIMKTMKTGNTIILFPEHINSVILEKVKK